MRGVPMVPIGTDGMRLRNKNKLACSCHQALPIEPLSDPDLVYFVLFVVNFFLRGEKVFVSVRERLRPSAVNYLLREALHSWRMNLFSVISVPLW